MKFMTKRIAGLLLATLLVAGLAPGDALAAKKSKLDKIIERTPPLRDFTVPEVTRAELENGMILYLVEDHDLPVIEMEAMIKTGTIYEPSAKVGMAEFMAEVMRSGGSEDFPGDELDELLENMGASVEAGMDDARGTLSAECLTENFDTVLDVFADLLRRPAFPAEKLELATTQAKTAISRRNDDADQIARREINKLYYGADSPYARVMEYDHVAAVTRDDLVSFHQYFYHPNNIILTVGGDFDTADMQARIEAAFGDWAYVDTFYPPDPVLTETEASVNYIRKEDVNQSKVRMGHLGIKHDDEYFFPLRLLNEILGGGFSSRLFSRVRSQEELAYSVYAWMAAGDHHRRPFLVGCDTKSGSTVKAIKIIRDEIRRVTVEEVTDEELDRAKEALKNSFVFKFSDPFSIAQYRAETEFYGKDPAFLDTYMAKVDAVTPADVLEAARARIYPDDMAVLVVGRAEDFDAPLSELGMGEVNEIDITIPEPTLEEEEIPEPTEQTLAEGARLLKASLAAHGGGRALDGMKRFETEAQFTVEDTPMGAMTFDIHLWTEKGHVRQAMSTPFGEMLTIARDGEGWMVNPMGVSSLTPDQVESLIEGASPDPVPTFRGMDGMTAWSLGQRDMDGATYDLVYLRNEDGDWIKLYLDPASHRISMRESRQETEQGPALVRSIYEDYREMEGFFFPFAQTELHNGEVFGKTVVKSLTINGTFEEGLFEEPK